MTLLRVVVQWKSSDFDFIFFMLMGSKIVDGPSDAKWLPSPMDSCNTSYNEFGDRILIIV